MDYLFHVACVYLKFVGTVNLFHVACVYLKFVGNLTVPVVWTNLKDKMRDRLVDHGHFKLQFCVFDLRTLITRMPSLTLQVYRTSLSNQIRAVCYIYTARVHWYKLAFINCNVCSIVTTNYESILHNLDEARYLIG